MEATGPFGGYDHDDFFDEVVDGSGEVRVEYRAIAHRFGVLGLAELARRQDLKDTLFRTRDITFTVYNDSSGGTERTFPLDLFPRVITAPEWSTIERGLGQRLRALNLFLGDIYDGESAIINDGVIPRHLVEESAGYNPVARGVPQQFNARALVAGIDLVRDDTGKYLVLEDNLRIPSGVSYVLENRLALTRLLPKVMAEVSIRPVEQYPTLLLRALQSVAPPQAGDHPLVAVLTPGPYNSAYFEHAFLAENMGVALVQGSDLYVEDEMVWMRTTRGPKRVDVIYRRVDDEFLDPDVFLPDSVLGVRGLVSAARAGNVSLANALGNGAADDKAMYAFVPEMIRYYLDEEPVLDNVETFLMTDEDLREKVLADPTPYVVKPVDGSGGYGIFVGPHASDEETAEMIDACRAEPERFIAQRVVKLSRHPTLIDGRLEPRHVDLRPFVVGGEYIDVLPGGLTRVALREGSLVVNSSQGGGSKDTWVEQSTEHKRGISRPLDRKGRMGVDPVLVRVAEPLFWTGRYLERMDGTARFLGEAHHSVLSGLPVEAGLRWSELLEVLALTAEFAETERDHTTYDVTRFLVDDPENLGSITCCVHAIRSNLRQVREKIPVELRTSVNDFWMELQDADFGREVRENPNAVFTRVARASDAFLGITESSMSRNDGWRFLTLGRLTERGLLMARLIDVYFVRMVGTDRPPVRQWLNLLRAGGALQEYRRVFQTSLDPMDAIGFLVQDQEFPRSLRWCIERADALLAAMAVQAMPVTEQVQSFPGGLTQRQVLAGPSDDHGSLARRMILELAERVRLPLPQLLDGDPSAALRSLAGELEAFSDQIHAEFFAVPD